MERLIRQLERTKGEELSCDECYELLDQFTELAHKGRDPSRLMPLVEQHLEVCRDCREEYEALMAVLDGLERD